MIHVQVNNDVKGLSKLRRAMFFSFKSKVGIILSHSQILESYSLVSKPMVFIFDSYLLSSFS